jgi:hypothetical protein
MNGVYRNLGEVRLVDLESERSEPWYRAYRRSIGNAVLEKL